MNINPQLSFENTTVAFQSKTNAELKETYFLFSVMNLPWLVKLGTWSLILALKLHFPIKKFIKNTIFSHFCGGESITDVQPTIDKLGESGIYTILDFSAEGGENESEFDKTAEEQLRIIEYASKSDKLPFTVMKISGVASNEILEKVQRKENLIDQEEEAYQRVKNRVKSICQKSYDLNVRLMIDAEETWIQEPIDELVYEMMAKYNKGKPVIWNTYQMYCMDMLGNLKRAHHYATTHGYWLGAKLVRGAYMEKEREMAEVNGYADPIQPNKEATDKDYNTGLKFCLDNKQRVALFAGTHNEYSSLYLATLMEKYGLKKNDPNFWFGQLYGMSDNISFTLAKEGFNVAKYVPYGPLEKVLPYLFRRAEENTSIAGQSSREYLLVKNELKRRKQEKQFGTKREPETANL